MTPVGVCCALAAAELRKEQEPYTLTFDLQIYPMRYYRFYHYQRRGILIFIELCYSSLLVRFYLLSNNSGLPKRYERVGHIFRDEPMTVKFSAFITFASDQLRSLSVDRRKCYFEDEGLPLDVCEADCHYQTVKSMCGCVPWFRSRYGSDECPLEKYSTCLNFNLTKFQEKRSCKCMLGCDHTSYLVESIKAVKPGNWSSSSIEMTWPHLRYCAANGGSYCCFSFLTCCI